MPLNLGITRALPNVTDTQAQRSHKIFFAYIHNTNLN